MICKLTDEICSQKRFHIFGFRKWFWYNDSRTALLSYFSSKLIETCFMMKFDILVFYPILIPKFRLISIYFNNLIGISFAKRYTITWALFPRWYLRASDSMSSFTYFEDDIFRRPPIATVNFTLEVRTIELALNPLPSLRVKYIMYGATSSGITGTKFHFFPIFEFFKFSIIGRFAPSFFKVAFFTL